MKFNSDINAHGILGIFRNQVIMYKLTSDTQVLVLRHPDSVEVNEGNGGALAQLIYIDTSDTAGAFSGKKNED